MFLAKPKTASPSLAAGLTVFLATACVITVAPRPARSDPPRDAPRKAVVETLKTSDFRRTTNLVGTVEASESVDLYPRFSGSLTSLKVDIGDAVKRGQVVAEIDAAELTADLELSKAQVAQAMARVIRAQAAFKVVETSMEAVKAGVEIDVKAQERCESLLQLQEKKFARYKDLLARSAIPQQIAEEQEQQVETAKAALAEAKAKAILARAGIVEADARREEAKADIEEVRADLRIAELDLRKAQILWQSNTIVAPMDGVVTHRFYHSGDFVRSGEGGSAPLITIIATGRMRVVIEVPDRDVPFLDKGDHATVRLNAIPDREFQGTVSRTAYAENPASQTLRTEIDLDNSDGRLRPGQFGVVSVLLVNRSHVLTVPASALVERGAGDQAACYRVVEGRAVRTAVKTGDNDGTRVEILDGVKEGDAVIADPGPGIKDGQAIEAGTTDQAEKK